MSDAKRRYLEYLKKREEALKDPNNPLYALGSNYYRNNFGVIRGLDDANYQMKKFPLFKLIKDLKIENGYDINSHGGTPST